MDSMTYALQRQYAWRFIIGMSAERFVELWKEQKGLCAICDKPMKLGNRGVNADHCHASGKMRKLLCGNCNNGLGMFQDNPELLEKAAEYIRQHKV